MTIRRFLRDQWFGPYGFRAMKTRRFWFDLLRVLKRSGWYIFAYLLVLYGSVYTVQNSGFLSVDFGTEHYFLFLGLGPFFWGITFAIANFALAGKFLRTSRDFANDAMRARLSQLRDVACWVDCCRSPNCQCGDCLLCGKVTA